MVSVVVKFIFKSMLKDHKTAKLFGKFRQEESAVKERTKAKVINICASIVAVPCERFCRCVCHFLLELYDGTVRMAFQPLFVQIFIEIKANYGNS